MKVQWQVTGVNNIISSTLGNDFLTGGAGADTFVFSNTAFGKDVVTDFKATGAGHDVLEFDHSVFASAAELLADAAQVGRDVVITHDTNDTITLVDINIHQLTANDFHIV